MTLKDLGKALLEGASTITPRFIPGPKSWLPQRTIQQKRWFIPIGTKVRFAGTDAYVVYDDGNTARIEAVNEPFEGDALNYPIRTPVLEVRSHSLHGQNPAAMHFGFRGQHDENNWTLHPTSKPIADN